ncbi:MAG: hypothetical protein HN509_14055 [Halobacteriovoraceae bacterium]|jgi:hypothetical protein|nr:hypothetical protein [Halobacteriovoraceae bacterium]MBT5095442.1 hypothetical protein [Halobacteriovoraceae bacterium]
MLKEFIKYFLLGLGIAGCSATTFVLDDFNRVSWQKTANAQTPEQVEKIGRSPAGILSCQQLATGIIRKQALSVLEVENSGFYTPSK